MWNHEHLPTMETLKRVPQGLPPNAMLEQTEATHQGIFYPMGEPLLFRTNDQRLLETAHEVFGQFPPPTTKPQQSPLVLEIFVHQVGSGTAPRPGDRWPQPIYRTHGHLYYVSLGANDTVVADLREGYAFGFITPIMAKDHPTLQFIFLEGLALTLLGTVRQFIPVHAACVVKDDLSITLLGNAGSGKSTLAYACVRRGYQLLAEDGLMIKCRPDFAELWGMPWKLHLLPDTKYFFPEIADEQAKLQVNGEWKLEVKTEAYHPGSTTTHAAPGPVLFLERGQEPGPTRLEPVQYHEAQEGYEVVWPWWVGWTDVMERRLAHLLEQGAYRLWMNGSPDEAVDRIDSLVAEIRAASTPSV